MEEKELSDYLGALRRHKLVFSIIFATVLAISILAALFLPPVYRSTSTILIEEQEIPTDLVRSTITSFAAQRLQSINQRVMTRSNLTAIIDKFNLYEKERKKETTDDVLERMRKDITFETLSADVIDPRSGQPTKATIAFTLSYDAPNPDLAQKIDNEITSLYLEENLRMRTRQTAEASDFLTSEVKQIGDYAAELEQKLSDFKATHLQELPEQKQTNMQAMERTESEIRELDLQIRNLQERQFFLDNEISQIPPESPVINSTGQHVMSSTDRLKTVRSEYLSLAAQYSEKHPDVIKARQQMEALEKEVGKTTFDLDQFKRLNDLKGKRAGLSEKYADNHPDIIALDKKIAALERSIDSPRELPGSGKLAATQADNPAYLNLVAQKESYKLEIEGLAKRRNELKAKLRDYQVHVQKSPDVERQYFSLLRDWENTNARYRELKAKQMEAQVAEQLERKSKGERFSIIEPPLLPEKPVKPNRPVIAILGLLLALVLAGGYVGLNETLDDSIRKNSQIVAIAGAPPLAVIPYVKFDEQVPVSRKSLMVATGAIAGAIILSLLLFHWLVAPLDVFWFRGLRKLDQILG